jgi:hypothetical protein
MQTILGSYIGTICLCYIDDLFIMADSAEELNQNIRLVLARLDQFNLLTKLFLSAWLMH